MLSIHSSPVGAIGTRDTGGMSVFLQETSRLLASRDNRVDIITLGRGKGEQGAFELFAGVRLIVLYITGCETVTKENLFDRIDLVYQACCKFIDTQGNDYDILHSHYWLSALLGERLAGRYALPHCVSFHTLGEVKNLACREEFESQHRIFHERRIAAECDGVVAFTRAEKIYLSRLKGVTSSRIHVVPCGVNSDVFRPVANARRRLNHGVEKGQQILLFVGRRVPIKGIDILLEVMEILREVKEMKLLIVGGDDSDGDLESASFSGDGRIIMVGRVPHTELPTYYSAADALIVPSYHESFSLVVMEALACGTPVIGTGVGCIPEVINDGNGVIIEPGAIGQLKQAIENLTLEKHPFSSREEIRESILQYTWQKSVDDLRFVYEKMNRLNN